MLTKTIVIGKMEIHEDGSIGLREDTVIADNGVEVARTYHRRVLDPGANVSAEVDARLVTVSAVVWTADVVTAFREKQAKAKRAERP